jgi:DNA-binding winged helix-turn-helix (wHTH) protein
MSAASPIQFASLRIDRSGGGVFRLDAAGSAVPVAIGSRALDVLCALAAHPGEVVSKRQIMDAVWPDMAVQEKNLTMQVSALRQVLEREGGRGWIQTIPGRGYRLVAPLESSLIGVVGVKLFLSPQAIPVGHSLLFAVGAWPPHDGVRRARRLNLSRDLRGITALRLQTLSEIASPIVPTGTTRHPPGQAET